MRLVITDKIWFKFECLPVNSQWVNLDVPIISDKLVRRVLKIELSGIGRINHGSSVTHALYQNQDHNGSVFCELDFLGQCKKVKARRNLVTTVREEGAQANIHDTLRHLLEVLESFHRKWSIVHAVKSLTLHGVVIVLVPLFQKRIVGLFG